MKFLKIKSIKKINLDSKLYDIQTKNENFFCNGILVHNSLFQISVKSPNLRDLDGTDDDFLCFTRFSFANQQISDLVSFAWRELALSCLSDGQKAFMRYHPRYTFVFEFCSPYTQVVKFFPEPVMIMTGIFDNQMGEEVSVNNEVYKQAKILFTWAKTFNFKSLDEIQKHLDQMSEDKSTDEGFVVKDNNGIRLKIKNKWYLKIHRLSNNSNLCTQKTLIPLILSGDSDEVLAYYPALKDSVEQLQTSLQKDIEELKEIYYNVITKETQKDFALYLTKEVWTPFACIFFNLRKEFGNGFTFQQVEAEFMKSEELIVKVYKTRGILKEEDEDE